MACFDVYADAINPDQYLLDIQSEILSKMATRVVVPLVKLENYSSPVDRLNPVFSVQGNDYVMLTQYLSGVRNDSLRNPITNIVDQHEKVTIALDMLFQGF